MGGDQGNSLTVRPGTRCSCPPMAPPGWEWVKRDLSKEPKTGSIPANIAIETVYRNQHYNHAVLSDSMYVKGRVTELLGTRLPKGTSDRKFADYFLERYYGTQRPLQPDIIDFTKLVIYEIKTEYYQKEGDLQLEQDYKLANLISTEYDSTYTDPSDSNARRHYWERDLATWYPPHIIHLVPSGDAVQRIVCTGLSDYTRYKALIIYRVYELRKKKPEEKRDRKQVAIPEQKHENETVKIPRIVGLHPPLDTIFEQKIQEEIIRKVQPAPPGTRFYIIAEPVFYREFIEKPEMERKIKMLQFDGMNPKVNPVMGFRNLNLTILTIAAATEATIIICVMGGVLVGPAAAATASVPAAATEAVTGTTLAEATVTYIGKKTVEKAIVENIAKAAGVLLVLGIAKDAKAENITFEKITIVRADEVHIVNQTGQDATVNYNGKEYQVIGTAES